jgi:hypothetical protein
MCCGLACFSSVPWGQHAPSFVRIASKNAIIWGPLDRRWSGLDLNPTPKVALVSLRRSIRMPPIDGGSNKFRGPWSYSAFRHCAAAQLDGGSGTAWPRPRLQQHGGRGRQASWTFNSRIDVLCMDMRACTCKPRSLQHASKTPPSTWPIWIISDARFYILSCTTNKLGWCSAVHAHFILNHSVTIDLQLVCIACMPPDGNTVFSTAPQAVTEAKKPLR